MIDGLRVSAFLAGKALQRGNKGTLVLTVMIIALVFVNLVFLPSIVAGVVVMFNQQSVDYNYGNLVVEPRENEQAIEDAGVLVRRIERIPGVLAISPRLTAGGTVTFHGTSLARSVIGIDPTEERRVTRTSTRMIEGVYLSDGDTDAAVIGRTIAGNENPRLDTQDSLGGVRVGDSITVTYTNGAIRRYLVKGIFQTDSYSTDASVFVTRRELEGVTGRSDQASQLLVRTGVDGDEEAFRLRLYSYGVQETVRTWQEKSRGIIGDVTNSFAIINLISTAVSLVIAIVVIFIVVFINTVNRRRQIGILKAIGIEPRLIVGSYVIQVLVICGAGAAAGLVLLAGVVQYLTLYPLRFPGGPVLPVVELLQVAQSVASLFVVSTIAGYVPAWKVAGEEILEAIRG